MKQMNHQIYRMSIEWSRIEPNEGQWSQSGIDHYIDEIKMLKQAGIEPLITLHHFSHPQWFEELGQWTNKKSVNYFVRFTEKVIESIGDLVNEYCIINEPNVFVNDTFMDGKYPPGHKDDIISYFKAAKNLIKAHKKAYDLIHSMRKTMGYTDTMVGMAIHLAYFEAKDNKPLARLSKKLMDYSFHRLFLHGMIEGKIRFPIGLGISSEHKKYSDFIGVNYYSRHLIHSSSNPAMLFGEVMVEEGLSDEKVNDLGWEIYPEGMYKVIKEVYEKYKLPIYITENGIADANDTKRTKFIYDHMVQICRLVDDGVDLRKYYHWSTTDNLEWNDGYAPRFGLVEIDFKTQERRIRDSGRFYAEICKNKEISSEMINKYL